MSTRKTLSLAACALLVLAGCKKDDDDEAVDIDFSSAQDNARAEDAFSDALTQVDLAADMNGLRDTDDPCDPVVTFDTIANPHTITVDFGSVNCTALNGRMRRGRLLATYTGRYRDPGTVITITPQDYYVNNNHVQGTKTVTNMGLNNQGQTYFNISVNGSLAAADGSWTATHNANRTRTWVQGEGTAIFSDDAYLITGGGSGVNRNGVAYTVNITSALRVEAGCPFITQGIVEVIPQDRPARIIDHGSGSCDGTFTVTVNGQTFTVTIG